MSWETPIIDRTQENVNRVVVLRNKINTSGWNSLTVAEQSEWLTDMKGAYNNSDMNRVGMNIVYLAELFTQYGYMVIVSSKADWARDDIPTPEQLEQYLSDIQALINAYYTMPTTPALPGTMEDLGYTGANAIEQILLDMKQLLEGMMANFRHSGDIYAGEGYFN